MSVDRDLAWSADEPTPAYPAGVEWLVRAKELRGSLAHTQEELRGFRLEVAERDGRILGALGRIEALSAANAVRIARIDGEREVTRDQVREIHRWAEELKRDADASGQAKVLSLREATDAIAARTTAEIERARAEAKLSISEDARRSQTSETTIIRTERRGRSWQLATVLVAALAGALLTGGASVGVWWVTRPVPPAQATQGK